MSDKTAEGNGILIRQQLTVRQLEGAHRPPSLHHDDQDLRPQRLGPAWTQARILYAPLPAGDAGEQHSDMSQDSAAQPPDAVGPTRSIGEALLALLSGSLLLPMLQGMATQLGEDLYAWVRRSLPSKEAQAAEEHLLEDGQVALVDDVRRVIFQLPADLTDREAVAILGLKLPTDGDAWLLVKKDYARRAWMIVPTDGPPTRSIDATREEPPGASAE
ncbi:hypothetical protein [Streptomyces sp. P17]|uniref:hypothetical protein n=1 Tax=Streptomyces sp. P17 TaxID=3074716 RepID=UPI0028F3EFDA|nr:hypothetical protein [Streptomyces sp. P17]MDT9698195.1 hypothetical protein [Streptomyces sp. P17]